MRDITNQDLIKAHDKSLNHRKEIENSSVCGYFFCLNTFSPNKIWEWYGGQDGKESDFCMCPYCGIDAVIGDKSGYPVTDKDFLLKMNEYWFNGDAKKIDMKNFEATTVLYKHLEKYRKYSYKKITSINQEKFIYAEEVSGPSGREYQIEICTYFDDRKNKTIRVIGSICSHDDKNAKPWQFWKIACTSLVVEDFKISPDGTIVDE